MNGKRIAFVLAGVALAAGIVYLSRNGASNPASEEVAGALGGKRLPLGSTVCVNKLLNTSERTQISLEGVEESLVTQLNAAGFKGRLLSGSGSTDAAGAKADCDGTVYGEVVALRGKGRLEAEVDFRLMIAGDQTPYLSSSAKGKSLDRPSAAEAKALVSAAMPGSKLELNEGARQAEATREALAAAFAGVARQIQEQRTTRASRGSAD